MVLPLCEGGLRKGTVLLPGLWILSGRKLSPGTHPEARYFNFSPYVTDKLPAAALVPSRGSESA